MIVGDNGVEASSSVIDVRAGICGKCASNRDGFCSHGFPIDPKIRFGQAQCPENQWEKILRPVMISFPMKLTSEVDYYAEFFRENGISPFLRRGLMRMELDGESPVMSWHSSLLYEIEAPVVHAENGLLGQSTGMYVDRKGVFSDSSICEDFRKPADEEKRKLKSHLQEMGINYLSGPNSDGLVLLALQMRKDNGYRNYCSYDDPVSVMINECSKVFGDRLVVRPHPLDQRASDGHSVNLDSLDPIGPRLNKFSAIVTANSTVAVESLAAGVPVATFGTGTFTGHGITLDCSESPEKLSGILDFSPEQESVVSYLCACFRRHIVYAEGICGVSENEVMQGFVRDCLKWRGPDV